MAECAFPTCKSFAQPNGMCIGHRIYASTPMPPKEVYKIPQVSEKRKAENKVYEKVKKEIKAVDGDDCQVKSPVCTGKAQGANHKQKSSPSNRTNKNNLTPCCNACNGFIENNQQWAEDNGHFISKFKKLT